MEKEFYHRPVQRSHKRLLLVLTGLLLFTLGAALLYQIGMSALEGKPRTFLDSLEWASETLSTTGYGRDAHWTHPAMVILVVIVQFAGVFLFFLLVPILLLPFLESRFEERLPRRASEWLAHHVIVFRYGPAVESLLQKLHDRDVPTLVVETDEEAARAAADRGLAVVFTRAEEDALDVSRLEVARAIVANGRDEENAALILRARQLGFQGEIYAFVEEPAHRKPMELAGATAAYTPRHIVAAALAAHASNRISPRMPGLDAIEGLQRRELRVRANSPLAGKTLGEAALDAVVVGQWNRSQLHAQCIASMVIEPGAVLEVVGDEESLAAAASAIGGTFLRDSGPFVIAGFGEVGRKVHQLLTDVGEEVRVVERRAAPGVDIVGDILDSSVISRAGVSTARGLVLALDSDDSTLFATVIARDCAPDVPVIARVNHARNLDNMHRAGADYALSISDISGEMLTSRLLGRAARARDERRRLRRLDATDEHANQPLATLPLCVIAIERGGITIPARRDLRVDAGDVLVVVSS